MFCFLQWLERLGWADFDLEPAFYLSCAPVVLILWFYVMFMFYLFIFLFLIYFIFFFGRYYLIPCYGSFVFDLWYLYCNFFSYAQIFVSVHIHVPPYTLMSVLTAMVSRVVLCI